MKDSFRKPSDVSWVRRCIRRLGRGAVGGLGRVPPASELSALQ